MISSHGYAAHAAAAPLAPFEFERREPGMHDVVIDVQYCGVCHSDVHFANNDWGFTTYPLVRGHEIIGRVRAVGDAVTRFAVGDTAAIGCLVDSCRTCAACQAGEEHACRRGPTPTYGGLERDSGRPTFGGYSDNYVVDERFALRVADDADLAATAPLLCAGITTYSPLRHWRVGPGDEVGIVGIGGLGHLAVKLAHAMGAHVVAFTTSPAKADDARRLGADEVIVSSDRDAMRSATGRLGLIVDTVSADHDLNALVRTLRPNGTLCLVGMGAMTVSVAPVMLAAGHRQLSSSLIGGLPETQEMLDFCAHHGVTADIEPIAIEQINDAYERLLRNDVRYRSVIDLATLTPGEHS